MHTKDEQKCSPIQNSLYLIWWDNILLILYLFSDINEFLTKRSVLALVDGKPWDMHRPLEEDCVLKFLHMLDEDPKHCNEVRPRVASLEHLVYTSLDICMCNSLDEDLKLWVIIQVQSLRRAMLRLTTLIIHLSGSYLNIFITRTV